MRLGFTSGVLLVMFVACDGGSGQGSEAKPSEPKAAEGGAVSAFTAYQAKSKAVEARVELKAIANAVRVLFEEESFDPASGTVSTGKLPPSIPMTPPAGSCCKQPGGTCPPDMGSWDHEGWKVLQFRPHGPHRYSYEVVVEGQTVTVRAVGDLDCDGELSTYESKGTVVDGVLEMSPEVTETAPLE